jgi:hypothetical protein
MNVDRGTNATLNIQRSSEEETHGSAVGFHDWFCVEG